MKSENKDEKPKRETHWMIIIIVLGIACGILLEIMYIIDSDFTVKEFFDPCTYSVGEVLNITIPTEQNTLRSLGFRYDDMNRTLRQKKSHCDEELSIDILGKLEIPKDFTGSLKVEIVEVTGVFSYIGKVIHIKPK